MDKITCPGCGVLIQTENPSKSGYIDKKILETKDNFLCKRCFRLKNYNEIVYNEEVSIDINNFIDNSSNNLIVNIVDCFDLSGSIIDNLNQFYKSKNILIIATKYDLFLRSNRPTKIKKYINDYLDNLNITTLGVIITSANDTQGIYKLYNSLVKMSQMYDKLYFTGVCNVGKSSLIKSLYETITEKKIDLVTSNSIATTQSSIEIKINDLIIIDTPGIINKNQITYYLTKKTLNHAIPKKFVKPKSFQLNPNQSIIIEGFGYFSYFGETKCSIVTYFSNLLNLHRTKSTNARSYLETHKDDLIRFPTESERLKLGSLKDVSFENIIDSEICLSGIGFIGFYGKGTIVVTTYEKVSVNIRKQLI